MHNKKIQKTIFLHQEGGEYVLISLLFMKINLLKIGDVKMKLKLLDRIIIVVATLAVMITTAVSVSAASTYTSTLSLSSKGSFYGALRKYDGKGNMEIYFDGTGSANNGGENVIELFERILVMDASCGSRYVGTDVDEVWDNCPSGKYKFWFHNVGTTTWKSDAVTMESW